MTNYAIRLKNIPGYEELVQEFFTQDFIKRCIRIHHMGKCRNNPHWHFLIETTEERHIKREALAYDLNKVFTKSKGNKHISTKYWDNNIKAKSYLFHEGTEPDMIKGFTEEELEDARELNRQTQEKFKQNAPAKIVHDCSEYFKEKGVAEPTNKMIFDYIFDRLRDNGNWLPNKYQFERYAHRIQANVRPDPEWGSYKKGLYELWFGSFSYL